MVWRSLAHTKTRPAANQASTGGPSGPPTTTTQTHTRHSSLLGPPLPCRPPLTALHTLHIPAPPPQAIYDHAYPTIPSSTQNHSHRRPFHASSVSISTPPAPLLLLLELLLLELLLLLPEAPSSPWLAAPAPREGRSDLPSPLPSPLASCHPHAHRHSNNKTATRGEPTHHITHTEQGSTH